MFIFDAHCTTFGHEQVDNRGIIFDVTNRYLQVCKEKCLLNITVTHHERVCSICQELE